MKILVFGAKGQLGVDLVRRLSGRYEVIGLDSSEANVADIDCITRVVAEVKPDLIINSAAYTNVDGCEKEVDTAYKVNALGVRNIAAVAVENCARVLHLSTDFVFDGENNKPYIEFDRTNPLSVYGKSKLAGEDLLRAHCPKHYILRTAWLYGKNGNNFVKTMLKLAEDRKLLSVVDDQIGSPTYTEDLVSFIEFLIKTDAYGTYHATCEGQGSWNDFAKKIFELSGKRDIEVASITTEELNRPAKRPKYSVLKNYMAELQFDYHFRHWEDALKAYFL